MTEPTRPPPVLDYGRRMVWASPWRGDRLVLLLVAVVAGGVAVGVLAATVELWIATWPSFGMTLLAAPAGVVALAFGSVAVTAVRVAVGNDAP